MNRLRIQTHFRRNRSRVVRLLLLQALLLISSKSLAYTWLNNITQLEYLASSPTCKVEISKWNANRGYPLQFVDRLGRETSSANYDGESVGGWHYCGGAIRIQRAEQSTDPIERQQYIEKGIADAHYSYNRIEKSNPWAAEMGVTIARGYAIAQDNEIAFKYLDEVLSHHPDYRTAYMAYGIIYYRNGEFDSAAEYFTKANEVRGRPSAEATYYLGLVAVKQNDLERARGYADEAKKLGYPLLGLERLIAREEASQAGS